MNDGQVAELLDSLTQSYDERRGDWERVAAHAGTAARRVPPPRWSVQVLTVATAAAAVAAVVLAWPFAPDQPGLLERARAAIGDGPVLHVVLRGEWGGALVDLTIGKRRAVYGEDEVWYDSAHGRVHALSRLGGVVQHEELYEPEQPPAELAALAREYKRTLDAGTARIAGEDAIGGEPVVWITIHSEVLPDVADREDHNWAQQVAVSQRTFKPVALREARGGNPGPGTTQRVLHLELLAAGQGDFTASGGRSLDGAAFKEGREPITLDEARATLGRTPLWLGREYGNLPFAQAFKETVARGQRREVEITGPDAQGAVECTKQRGAAAGACFRALGLGSITVRSDGVFKSDGPIVWSDEQTRLVLFYGTVDDDPSTFHEDAVPLDDRPHLTIVEATTVGDGAA